MTDEFRNVGRYIQPLIDSLKSIDTVAIEETLNREFAAMKQTMSILKPIIDSTQAIFESQQESIRAASAQFREIARITDGISQPILKITNELAEMVKSQVKWVEYEKQYRKAEKSYVRILAESGWPPLLRIPAVSIHEFVQAFDEDPQDFRQSIDRWMIEYHDSDVLNEIREAWRGDSTIADRFCILDECITCHIERRFNVTVPAMLAQLEGIIASSAGHTGRLSGPGLLGYVDALIEGNSQYSPVRGLVIQNLYDRFEWGDASSLAFTRHAILHGAFLRYGTEKASLMLLLLLDFILFLIEHTKRTENTA